MDATKLELLKNKERHAQSAVASQEVREHLAGFIRSKQLGSSSQISQQVNLAEQTGGGQTASTSVAASGAGALENDHPLRKTASLPTMHIPYPTRSLSGRRRQIERRTTMSPLSRRKSRPRRPLLSSLGSSTHHHSAEYSSNPCIINSSRNKQLNDRSLSQSNSPPPQLTFRSQLATSTSDSAQQQHALISQPLFRQASTSFAQAAGTTKQQLDCRLGSVSQTALHTQTNCAPTDETVALNKQQQHLLVNEAIRKTVINRTSNRNLLAAVGGSLDGDSSQRVSSLPVASCGAIGQHSSTFGCAENEARRHFKKNQPELRQWSLDNADLRCGASASKLAPAAAANRTLAWGTFHREFYKMKLATTNEVASLRRSQSPSSSMGPARQPFSPSAALLENSRSRQFSSVSSSSTSSLVSAQDSFEDSTSQAIDLSSSSKANRHRQQQQAAALGQQLLCNGQSAATVSSQFGHQLAAAATRPSYQKVLPDSFNQLQLCQSQSEKIQQLLAANNTSNYTSSSSRDTVAGQLQFAPAGPLLGSSGARSAALDLDVQMEAAGAPLPQQQQPEQQSPGDLWASLCEQFNLSTSAQNLISVCEVQQPPQQHQQAAADGQHWPLVHSNLLHSAEFLRANQITSSLLAKVTSLPEQYRYALLNHLLQRQRIGLISSSPAGCASGGEAAAQPAGGGPFQQSGQHFFNPDGRLADERAAIISRAHSSPLLVAGALSNGAAPNNNPPPGRPNGEAPMQSVEFDQVVTAAAEQQPGESERGRSARPTFAGLGLEGAKRAPADWSESELEGGPKKAGPTAAQQSLDLTLSVDKLGAVGQQAQQQRNESKTNNGDEGAINLIDDDDDENKPKVVVVDNVTLTVPPANFCYSLGSSAKVNCSFMYTPVFDANSSTGLIYELEMCNHKCICAVESNHPENSYRILAVWRRLHDRGLMAKCARIPSRRATIDELRLCHDDTYINYFGKTPYERIKLSKLDLTRLPIEGLAHLECGGQGADIDTPWNEEQTPGVARLAAGCVIEAAVNIAEGRLMNAFAVVRPPGHHAETSQAMGFCFFNSIALATRVLMSRHNIERVLIVDWDVHHGNGLQKMFYGDKNILYISLHRHDRGNFFPGTGAIREVGSGAAEGYNWNIAWSDETMGDAEYMAAFRSVVMPIARDFSPSVILVACGFDAARGHPFNFGGYELTPACFAYMTRQLMTLANGRVVLCLEGGYQLEVLCECAESCVRALLNESRLFTDSKPNDQIEEAELRREPNPSACETLLEVSSLAMKYWPSVARFRGTIELSALDAANLLMSS